MRQLTQEEMFHAVKMYDYVNERGGRVILQAIGQPPAEWTSAAAVFSDVLAHEQKVTGLINELANLALDERDHATSIFLQWFISEQVEEEASASQILNRLKMIGNDANGLFVLDRELSLRRFTPPQQPQAASPN
jgi:ferritin